MSGIFPVPILLDVKINIFIVDTKYFALSVYKFSESFTVIRLQTRGQKVQKCTQCTDYVKIYNLSKVEYLYILIYSRRDKFLF